jgi:hypothetical protein
MRQHILAVAAGVLLFAGSAQSAVTTIPSCYTALGVSPPPATSQTRIFVLVDQTVALDPSLKDSLVQNALALVQPGNAFEVTVFSAYNQGRYMDTVAQGALERPLPPARRNATGSEDLENLNICLTRQFNYGRRLMASTILKSLGASSPALSRSDILGSLVEAGRHIRDDPAQRKVVLVASDMLENSVVTSFYRHGGVRTVVPAQELQKVRAAGMLADFGGAEIYVLGGAMLPLDKASAETDATAQTYRSPVTLRALRDFWTQYFALSQARLVEFGEPALLSPVR